MAVSSNTFAQDSEWNAAIEAFINDPALRGASVGFAAMEVGADQLEAEYNAGSMLTPASSQKVLTCATALELLSPKHRFTTTLGYRGEITDGVLNGDIFIVGGGDPSLGSDRFTHAYGNLVERWGAAIQALGIKQVKGTILIDESKFDDEILAGSTSVADAGNYYAAGAHALSYKDNRYTLTFSSVDKDGGMTRILSTEPSIGSLKIKNEVRASSVNADNAYIYAIPGESFHVVRGTIPMGKASFEIQGALPNPGLVLAREMEAWLEEAGISLTENPIPPDRIRDLRRLRGPLTEVDAVQSPKLAELVPYILEKSDNSYADILLKTIGLHVYREGSFEKGALAVYDHWEGKLNQADGMHLVDGSGLSRLNSLSAAQLAGVCAAVSPETRKILEQGFQPLNGNARIDAKSGTLTRVKSYTGYFTTSGGSTYAFSLIVNHFSGSTSDMKRRMARMLDTLVRS